MVEVTEEEPNAPATKRKASEDIEAAPLMKRQVKAASPSTQKPQAPKAPIVKAPIAKVPPAGKAPIAKVAKVPVAKVAKAPIAKRPPPGQAAAVSSTADASPRPFSSPANSPPGSPSDSEAPHRQASWQEFADTDPLYALLGEMGDKKVVNPSGEIDESQLEEYVARAVVFAKPADWIKIWAAMNLPVDLVTHALVVRTIIDIGVRSEGGDIMGDVLAELVKGHRAKVKAVEDALVTMFEGGCDEKDCLARFLLLLFPKSPTSEWGWSRTGWSWREWWQLAEKVFATLEPSSGFEALRTLLSAMETESGTYLPHQQIWDAKRLEIVRSALCRFGSLQEDELVAAVDISLS